MRNHGRSDGRVHQLLLLLVVKETEKERKEPFPFFCGQAEVLLPFPFHLVSGVVATAVVDGYCQSVCLLRSLLRPLSRTIFAQRVSGRAGASKRASGVPSLRVSRHAGVEDRGHFLNRRLDRRPQQSLMLIRCLCVRPARPSPSRDSEEKR